MRGIRRRWSWRARALTMGLIAAILLVCGDALLRPAIGAVAANRAAQLASGALASTMDALQTAQPELFEGLTGVTESAGVRYLSVNAAAANRLKTAAAVAVTERFESPEARSIAIPLGTLTGMQLLSGMGPEVRVRVQMNGAAGCEFRSEFRAAGINQTVHRLTLEMTVTVAVLLPFRVVETTGRTAYLVSETVLLGETPDFYVG